MSVRTSSPPSPVASEQGVSKPNTLGPWNPKQKLLPSTPLGWLCANHLVFSCSTSKALADVSCVATRPRCPCGEGSKQRKRPRLPPRPQDLDHRGGVHALCLQVCSKNSSSSVP